MIICYNTKSLNILSDFVFYQENLVLSPQIINGSITKGILVELRCCSNSQDEEKRKKGGRRRKLLMKKNPNPENERLRKLLRL
jgi:hypothetical protein